MSTENLTKFQETVAASPELQDRLRSIEGSSARETAEKISDLAAESGLPFTPEEFLGHVEPAMTELSDEQLEAVAGGVWDPSLGNIMMSIFTAGVLCAAMAGISAAVRGGNADHKDCQSKSDPNAR